MVSKKEIDISWDLWDTVNHLQAPAFVYNCGHN